MVRCLGYGWVTGVEESGELLSESGASESIAFPEYAPGFGVVEKDEGAEEGHGCRIAGTHCPILRHYVCRELHSGRYTYHAGDYSPPLGYHILFLRCVHHFFHHAHHPRHLYLTHRQWSQAFVCASNASSKTINGKNL